jgi:hypothetical protein
MFTLELTMNSNKLAENLLVWMSSWLLYASYYLCFSNAIQPALYQRRCVQPMRISPARLVPGPGSGHGLVARTLIM